MTQSRRTSRRNAKAAPAAVEDLDARRREAAVPEGTSDEAAAFHRDLQRQVAAFRGPILPVDQAMIDLATGAYQIVRDLRRRAQEDLQGGDAAEARRNLASAHQAERQLRQTLNHLGVGGRNRTAKKSAAAAAVLGADPEGTGKWD